MRTLFMSQRERVKPKPDILLFHRFSAVVSIRSLCCPATELISLNFPSVIRTTTEPVCGQLMTWVGTSLAARAQVTTIVKRAAGKIFVMVVLRPSQYVKSSSPQLVLRLRLRRGGLNDDGLLRELTLNQHHLLYLVALQRLLCAIDADHHRSERHGEYVSQKHCAVAQLDRISRHAA